LAVNRKWTNRDGTAGEEVLFIDCSAWGRTAEVVSRFCRKGSAVLVDGRLRLETWERSEGGQGRKISLQVDTMQMLDGRSSQQEQGAPPPPQKSYQKPLAEAYEPPPDDGVPF